MYPQQFYSHGKLLLTGEYLVLDGAKALALPCKLGQSLKADKISSQKFEWKSYLKNGKFWKSCEFDVSDMTESNYKNDFEKRLFEILNVIYQLKPHLFKDELRFTTQLEFEKNWGLGSSSTLIYNLSQWAGIDAYFLLDKTFGGSGYDIAAANMNSPFFFQRKNNKVDVEETEIDEKIKPYIYFLYLNKKQNSREGISRYRQKRIDNKDIQAISLISEKLSMESDINEFEISIKKHENIVSSIIGIEPVHSRLFPDYKSGVVKSLGAWGGDFVLVTACKREDLHYFEEKGYDVIYNYKDLVF